MLDQITTAIRQGHEAATSEAKPTDAHRWEYHMVQIPPTIQVARVSHNDAAHYLEEVVNRFARDGWEFYRVDEIGVTEAPGCLSILSGGQPQRRSYYVVTFRRPAT